MLGGGPATAAEGGGKYFVKPTIFTGVHNKMRIAQEEVFGPVLSVIKFKDEAEAIQIANDIAYGLGSGVWTQSVRRATMMAQKIKAGTVWVNTYRAVSLHDAVRRLQGVGTRPRERRRCDRGLSPDKERVDQQRGRRWRQPVCHEDGVEQLTRQVGGAER